MQLGPAFSVPYIDVNNVHQNNKCLIQNVFGKEKSIDDRFGQKDCCLDAITCVDCDCARRGLRSINHPETTAGITHARRWFHLD